MALKKIKTPDFMASINEAKMLHSQKEEITEAVCEQTEETVIPEKLMQEEPAEEHKLSETTFDEN